MPKCEECEKEFSSDQGLSDHKNHVHGSGMTSHERKEMKRKVQEDVKTSGSDKQKSLGRMKTIAMAVAVVVIIGGLFYVALNLNTSSQARTGPSASDHWHADYNVKLCGEVQPDLPPSEGGVHSHGDGLMHIHPHTADEIYENANIKLFFHNSGVTLTDTSISSEEWGTFENGDICANSTTPGILKLIVNDVDTKPIATYVPSDRDVVEIIFE